MYGCYEIKGNHIIICVKVIARSKRTELRAIEPSFIKICIKEEAKEDLANRALISFLSRWLILPETRIHFLTGKHAPLKHLLLQDYKEQQLLEFLRGS
jgi:uncharacterized protein YggU (UPF0235/DUF167 family)